MNEKPQLTILVPLYNSADFVDDLMECLVKNDTPRDIVRLVMIDDGSDDQTAQIVLSYLSDLNKSFSQVQFFQQHQNVGVTLNHYTLLTFVDTQYFCFVDNDDVFSPNKLSRQLAVMNDNPDIAMCGTDHVTITRNEQVVLSSCRDELVVEKLDLKLYLKNIPPCQNSSLVYRTSMFRLYKAGTKYHFDIATQISIMSQDQARMCILRFPFSGYRVGSGYSNKLLKNLPTFLKVIDDMVFPIICMGLILPRHIVFFRYLRFLLTYLKLLYREHSVFGLFLGVARALRSIRLLFFSKQSLHTLELDVLDAEKYQEKLIAIGH
ncbi:glycosyltransferase family 2 protein [Planktomarina temperata]|nr:glycosyltransferase family 2 protein [bacterium]MDB2458249.1 glycosyltransferase family 2 protein [Planktomarina temperata]